MFDPHVWLGSYGALFLRRIPKFIYLATAIMIVLEAPGRVWYPPLLFYVASALMSSMFAENIGVAQDLVVTLLVLYYILAIASLTFVNSVDKTTLILHMFLWQYLWWFLHSKFSGRVPWHPDLGNEDAFGPMMVMGIGYCFYFGMAARKRALRITALFLSGLCVAGVVSSFARGAVLGAGVVAAYMWFRSPRKGRTLAALVLGGGVFLVAAAVLFPNGEFWQEMSTISEGAEAGTGLDRWVLWKTAWRAFLARPIFGVGAGNFGIFASAHLWSGPAHGYTTNWHFWGRALHSIYFQVLSEFGLMGTIAFTALLVDFWRRNAELRSAPFVSGWSSATQRRFDLRTLSLGLEAAMVAYLAGGFFYDLLFIHWFYTLLIVNALLHLNAKHVVVQQRPDPSQWGH